MGQGTSTSQLKLGKETVTANGNVLYVNGVAAGTTFDDSAAGLGTDTIQGAIEAVKTLNDATSSLVAKSSPTPTGNDLVSGGGVAFVSNLDITVSAATYRIQGASYSSPITSLTAAAADPVEPRIDVVAVDSSGNAIIITGSPAVSPVKPDVDPETQLELTFYLVAAGATELAVSSTDIYHENAEWAASRSGTTFNLSSTNNPYVGSICIEGTSVTTNNYVQFTAPSDFDPADNDNLVFYIRSKAAWPSTRSLSITLRSGNNSQKGSTVTFKDGTFGFVSSITSSYQQIVIPMSLFSANGIEVDRIRFTVSGTGATFGMYLDDFTLQGGLAPIVDSTRMRWRGEYLATLLYNVNDVVLSGGTQYVCIQSGLGRTPGTQTTYWQPSTGEASTYTLPPATDAVLGGVKAGTGLVVSPDGTLSVSAAVAGVLLVLAWMGSDNFNDYADGVSKPNLGISWPAPATTGQAETFVWGFDTFDTYLDGTTNPDFDAGWVDGQSWLDAGTSGTYSTYNWGLDSFDQYSEGTTNPDEGTGWDNGGSNGWRGPATTGVI
jgi:hypothetical protein